MISKRLKRITNMNKVFAQATPITNKVLTRFTRIA